MNDHPKLTTIGQKETVQSRNLPDAMSYIEDALRHGFNLTIKQGQLGHGCIEICKTKGQF